MLWQVLEKCNRENIDALCNIIGVTTMGEPFTGDKAVTEVSLRKAGDLWANHVLENARAYIMTFVYIFVTVTIGYPLLYGISVASGLDPASNWMYLGKFCARVSGPALLSEDPAYIVLTQIFASFSFRMHQCGFLIRPFTFGCRKSRLHYFV